ncbi:MAG: helix-turn-helix domain-containing protein, partial [Bacillota bacterium]
LISVKEAAAALNLSTRQVIRLREGVSNNGAQALIHKNQGRPPAHKTTEELRKTIAQLKFRTLNMTREKSIVIGAQPLEATR